jgi:RimJ/RimL family protein N-acetyltransferase
VTAAASPIEIREATPADAELLLDFVNLMSPELNIKPGEFWVKSVDQEREEIAKYHDHDNSFFLTAWRDDELLGTLTLTGRGIAVGAVRAAEHHVAQLGISVHPDHRGENVGSALLETALAKARSEGVVKRVEISSYATNPRARALWLRHGFEIEGCRRRAIKRDGEYIDVYVLALLLD